MKLNEKKLTILGSTGSIGTQSLEVAQKHGAVITGLTANRNVDMIERQIRQFRPKIAAMMDEGAAKQLKDNTKDIDIKILAGNEGVCEVAALTDSDMVLNAIVGLAGLMPTLAALNNKKDLALANKETLVAGGSIVKRAAFENKAAILPVDSEHSAIFQSMQGCANPKKEIKRILLTGSGGPFFGKSAEELKAVTKDEALKHPNWDMGAKITIDSATLMNKGLEFIEAVWLFNLKPEQIKVIIHRESVIHSMVEYVDNSVIAQLGTPDMRIPIQYALTYPERTASPAGELNLIEYGKLSFYEPDEKTFKALRICREAILTGGTMPAAVNGANEEAVRLFLNDKIAFYQIPELVEEVYKNHKTTDNPELADILEADRSSREYVRNII